MDSVILNTFLLQTINNEQFKCFFLVPSENKRDNRTIEDVQAEIQAKKKLKLSQASSSTNETPNTS